MPKSNKKPELKLNHQDYVDANADTARSQAQRKVDSLSADIKALRKPEIKGPWTNREKTLTTYQAVWWTRKS